MDCIQTFDVFGLYFWLEVCSSKGASDLKILRYLKKICKVANFLLSLSVYNLLKFCEEVAYMGSVLCKYAEEL